MLYKTGAHWSESRRGPCSTRLSAFQERLLLKRLWVPAQEKAGEASIPAVWNCYFIFAIVEADIRHIPGLNVHQSLPKKPEFLPKGRRNSIGKDWNDLVVFESVTGFSLKQPFPSGTLTQCASMEERRQIHSLNVNSRKKWEKLTLSLKDDYSKLNHSVTSEELEMELSSRDFNQKSSRRLSGSPGTADIAWEYWLSVTDPVLERAVLTYPSQVPWCPKPWRHEDIPSFLS